MSYHCLAKINARVGKNHFQCGFYRQYNYFNLFIFINLFTFYCNKKPKVIYSMFSILSDSFHTTYYYYCKQLDIIDFRRIWSVDTCVATNILRELQLNSVFPFYIIFNNMNNLFNEEDRLFIKYHILLGTDIRKHYAHILYSDTCSK